MKKLIYLYLFFIFLDVKSETNIQAIINNQLQQYKRSLTMLEICFNSKNIYSLNFAKHHNLVSVILSTNQTNAYQFANQVFNNNLRRTIILNPVDLNLSMIEKLSKCEHFDLIILEDIFSYFGNISEDEFDYFLNLGEHVFFKVNWSNSNKIFNMGKTKCIYSDENELLFYSYKKKNNLNLVRFTQNPNHRSRISDYKIFSDYNNKIFVKDDNKTNWIHGINLVTFVMLKGIYPTNKMVSKMVIQLPQKIGYHNDLIIGNMVLQGHRLIPIDFADSRRNANMERCIDRALAVFGNNERLKDPVKRMKDYYENRL